MKIQEDLKQRDLEAFEEKVNELGVDEMRGQSRIAGAYVRAAVAAGWLPDLTLEGVGDLTGKETRRIARAVSERYEALTELDPLES